MNFDVVLFVSLERWVFMVENIGVLGGKKVT